MEKNILENMFDIEVTVPVAHKYVTKRGSDGKYYYEHLPTPHIFTLEAALDKVGYYTIRNLLEYNIPIRNIIRKYGLRDVADRIKEMRPDNKQITEGIDNLVSHDNGKFVGEHDIQIYSVLDDFTLFGKTIHGLADLEGYAEMYLYDSWAPSSDGRAISTVPLKTGDIHVGYLWRSYPCFDTADYETESGTFNNYIVRRHPITAEDLQKVKALPFQADANRIDENMPKDTLPLIYYVGGDCGYMVVATESAVKRITSVENNKDC